ncbi:MAG TPA: polyprenyl synthetase family protein, partial [Jatrophihabitans sp.]|nr:polyprenyl synthetase family protein [Jatrophihabitans sp.]
MSPAALGVEFSDAVLEASVRSGLDAVEAELRTAVASNDEFVGLTARHLVDAGGKRFRPLVSVLAAHFGDPSRPEVIASAVVCELTHLATLYHDDVMDEAAVRRGAASANARWDNTVAILTGDFLFSRASNILADLGPWAVRLQARTFERLVIGQIHETVGPQDGADPIAHYLGVLADKTGSLIATAAEFGAHFAGAGPDVVQRLRAFGEQIGVAFQLSDDILDIASDSAQSGKTPGTDLREGIPTLPVLYALNATDVAGSRLRELVSAPLVDDDAHAEALQLLRASDAMGEARATLHSYAETARATLTGLPDVPVR